MDSLGLCPRPLGLCPGLTGTTGPTKTPSSLDPLCIYQSQAFKPPHMLTRSHHQCPPKVVAGLNAFLQHSFGPNMLAYAPGGGTENCGIARAVNEMLVQAPNGEYIQLFPMWPAGEPATFTSLRTKVCG